MPSYDRALWALRRWLDSWTGIERVAVGMHRQGYDLQFTQYDERGWRATFYTTGMERGCVFWERCQRLGIEDEFRAKFQERKRTRDANEPARIAERLRRDDELTRR